MLHEAGLTPKPMPIIVSIPNNLQNLFSWPLIIFLVFPSDLAALHTMIPGSTDRELCGEEQCWYHI